MLLEHIMFIGEMLLTGGKKVLLGGCADITDND